MNNAGVATNSKYSRIKELLLDKDLKPLGTENVSLSKFKICFLYEDDTQDLVKIQFISYNNDFKNFEIEKHFIERYFSFKRSDNEAMEILRKNSLSTKSLVPLKKYVFECIQYI